MHLEECGGCSVHFHVAQAAPGRREARREVLAKACGRCFRQKRVVPDHFIKLAQIEED